MADKISNVTWPEPPNGGDPITTYRMITYQGDVLVDSIEGNPPFAATHSATLERSLVIQARNSQGWSVPIEVPLPPATEDDGSSVDDEGGTPVTTITAPTGRALSYDPGEFYWNRSALGSGWDVIDLYWRPLIATVGKRDSYSVTSPATITGASNGTTYDVWVRARDTASNTYADSAHSYVTVQATSHTSTPPQIAATRDGSNVTISFTDPGTSGTYQVQRDGVDIAGATSIPYVDVTDDAHTYQVKFVAENLTFLTNPVSVEAKALVDSFRDDFTPDGPLASTWEKIGGTLASQVDGEPLATRAVTNAYNGVILQQKLYTADQLVVIEYSAADAGGGAILRWVDQTHFFFLNGNSLYRLNGANLGSGEEQLGYFPVVSGDIIKVIDNGEVIMIYVNDVQPTWKNVVTDVDEPAQWSDTINVPNTGRVGLLLPLNDPGPDYFEVSAFVATDDSSGGNAG